MMMRGRILLYAFPVLVLTVFLSTTAFQSSAQTQVGGSEKPEITWTSYGGRADSSRYFDSKQITKENVQQLQVVWSWPYGEPVFHPIVARGAVYGRGRNGALVALDARTGRELWIREGMQAMTTRGMNYWESKDGKDRRLIFSMNDYLQEIDATTGKPILTFGNEGVVDLREGLGRDPATIGRIQSGTPGQVFENLIILGSATGEGYMSPPGDIRAFDVITGKQVWIFHTVPHPGEFGYETWPKEAWKYIGGVNAWGELTIDEARGIAFIPTGSPTFDYYGADRIGANLFSDCLIALDARTGKRLWHFQTTHHDLWDFDNNAALQLTTIRKDGRNIDVVALANKNGFLFVFNRVTGEPIWPIEERPVPRSEMPGEESWPTQPFPTNPPPFVKQSFTKDDINPYNNVTAQQRATFMERLESALNLGLYTPISEQWTLHIPGSNGGALFGTTSAEPSTGMVYVVGQNNPALIRLYKPGEGGRGGGRGGGGGQALPGQAIYDSQCRQCHGENREGAGAAPALLTLAGRLDAAAIATIVTNGRGQMPASPRLGPEEMDQLTAFLLAPGGRGGGGRGGGADGGRGAAPAGSGAPPELIVGNGGAKSRPPAGRGAGARGVSYPEGSDYVQYSINGQYGTIGNMMKPPYTVITAYDLNQGAIRWQTGFGDDPALAAQGIRGTGMTQMRNSVIVTASGLLFGFGGDSTIYAFDSATGKVLWSAPLGGAIGVRGSPVMYELDGRAYLLVPIGRPNAGGRGAAAVPDVQPNAPSGYVTFALP
jgi:quinoprotein glucose dehydrogenase